MSKKKILVVEDEAEMRMMLALELETSGYEVFQAADGEAGFEMAREVKPDLVISDVMMPKMDGNQFMKKLRATDFGKEIPFVVLTARGKMRDYFETVEVDDFIEKPFEPDELLAKVERLLKQPKSRTQRDSTDRSVDKAADKPTNVTKSDDKKKILIVENDLAVVVDIKNVFQDYGYQIKVVNSPAKCIEEIPSFKPDLIISKYFLDQINGDKLVEIVRNMSGYRDFPVLIYTNTVIGEEKQNALRAGAADFLTDINGIKLLKRANDILRV